MSSTTVRRRRRMRTTRGAGAAHAALDDETEDETVAENARTGEARCAALGAKTARPVGDGAAEKGAASSPPDEEAVPGRSPRCRSENARGRPDSDDETGAWPSMAASDDDDSVMDGAGPAGPAAAPAAPADETLMGEAVAEPGTRRGAAAGMVTSRSRRRPRAGPARTGGAVSASGGARTGAGAGTV